MAILTAFALAFCCPGAFADEDEKPASSPADPPTELKSEPETTTASSRPPLEGKTEVTELLLDEEPLYKQAMAAIEKGDYNQGALLLKELIPQLGEGYEPYRAECMFYEAGCHEKLKRMNAAIDTYHKAFELFEKYDASNPLKGKAWNQYFSLKSDKAKLDAGLPLQGGVQQATFPLSAQNFPLTAQKPKFAQFSIDPSALLEVKDNNPAVLLDVYDPSVMPKIVKECFSEMSCLETAEIGSNVTNADQRWMPLQVQGGRAAAFSINGFANPGFRAKVNGRSYHFDIVLPQLTPGQRKILVLTNGEKICAVDVENFDTWLLRMERAKDGRILTARWYKLEHKKPKAPDIPIRRRPPGGRNW